MKPSDPVRCECYRCTLSASVCATRSVMLKIYARGRDARYPECAACQAGKDRLAQLRAAGWKAPDGRQLRNSLRPDYRQQAAAKRRFFARRIASDFVPAQFGGVA